MDKPTRKKIRLDGYNYSQDRSYFLTVCAKDRKHIFGKVTVGVGTLDVPRVQLTNEGKTVEQVILSSSKMDGVFVDKYIIMPNHIHIMVTLRKNGTSGAPSPTNDISRFVAVLKRLSNKRVGYNMFQRSYYDHIIRDEDDYYTHIGYIENNAADWAEDKYYV